MTTAPRKPDDDVIATMRASGLSILDAIKAFRESSGISLGEAKRIVASHPAYRDVAVAWDQLHDEIIRQLEAAE